MLSVTTARVHQAMCPGTPQNTPERKDRSWSCDYNSISKRRSRASASRKNLSLRLSDPLELNIEVSSHPLPAAEKSPQSKSPIPKSPSDPLSAKSRRHAETLLKQEKVPTHSLCFNPLYKAASRRAAAAAAAADVSFDDSTDNDLDDKPPEVLSSIEIASSDETSGKSLDNSERRDQEINNNEQRSEKSRPPSPEQIRSSSPLPETGGKRKRGLESKLSAALKMLKSDDTDIDYAKHRPELDSTIEEFQPEDESARVTKSEPPESHLQPENWTGENWDKSQQETWNKNQQENWEYNHQDNWVNPYAERQEIWHNPQTNNWDNWDDGSVPTPADAPFSQIPAEEPFYMTGFPNPPAENRCWLNATLQTIFALPLVDPLRRLDMTRCSMLTKTLMAIQLFWRRGPADREVTYQTVARFKNQLDILDSSYSSQRQQDVSEFLMKLLNHVKSDCERIIREMKSSDEIENVPESSAVKGAPRSPQGSTKRPPLAPISPFKNRNDSSEAPEALTPKCQESPEEYPEAIQNPIDEFFLLPMMEDYVCQNCHKHRQRKVDNMMLYVDLPQSGADPIELSAAIEKTLEPEERTLTCAKCKCEEHKLYTSFRGTPNVLIVQINRYGMSDGYVAKMNSIVNIPEKLEIGSEEGNNEDHQLQTFIPLCIIAHVGSAMDCGHYTSYVKHGEQWFHYNDMSVIPMSTAEALTAAQTTAYLVFFANADLLPKSSSVEEPLEEVSR